MEYYDVVNDSYIKAIKDSALKIKVKVEILDGLEKTVTEITNDISKTNSGNINFSYQQGTRGTCSFSIFDPTGDFLPGPNSKYFWIRKKIKISIGVEKTKFFYSGNASISADSIAALMQLLAEKSIDFTGEDIDGETDTFWFSEGVYVIKDLNITAGTNGRIISISGIDKFGLFGSDTGYSELLETHKIPAEQQLKDAILDILKRDIGSGEVVDPIDPFITPSLIDIECPYDLTKGPGSSMGDLITLIANTYGCEVYYDNSGRLQLKEGTVDSSYSTKSPVWNFNPKEDGFDEPSLNLDLSSVINVVKVVGDNINGEVYESISENNNPSSSTRVDLIGRKTKYLNSSFAYNQDRADDYSRYMLSQMSVIQKSISFNSILLPQIKIGDVISLTSDYYGYDRERFIVQSISFSLGTATMQISASNLADLPYYEHGG